MNVARPDEPNDPWNNRFQARKFGLRPPNWPGQFGDRDHLDGGAIGER